MSRPSATLVSSPLLTASSVYFTLRGAFARILFSVVSARSIKEAAGTSSSTRPMRRRAPIADASWCVMAPVISASIAVPPAVAHE